MPGDVSDLLRRLRAVVPAHPLLDEIGALDRERQDLRERLAAMTSAATSAAATAERACERLVLYQGVVDAAKKLKQDLDASPWYYEGSTSEVDAVADAYDALEHSMAARVSA